MQYGDNARRTLSLYGVRCYTAGDIVCYKKCSWEGGHGYCLSERKKQNSNRVRGVEVLSILTRVKNAKKG
jgi:hypothetical protein